MFAKRKNLRLEIVKVIDRDYWGKLMKRTTYALSCTPRREGRVISVNFKERTYELVH